MTLPDGPQRDLSIQVAMVRAKARPWRAIIALVLAICAAVTSRWAHSAFHVYFTGGNVPKQLIAAGTAAAFCVFGSVATYSLSSKARSVVALVTGPSHAAIVQYLTLLVGGVTTLVITLVLFDVPVGQLVLGGALTSVFVGIAAQQALSNVFAGMVLLFAHPFRVGDDVRLRAGAIWGEIDGTITEIGITYVRISTVEGLLAIPNSQVLNAVIGPRPAPPAPSPAP